MNGGQMWAHLESPSLKSLLVYLMVYWANTAVAENGANQQPGDEPLCSPGVLRVSSIVDAFWWAMKWRDKIGISWAQSHKFIHILLPKILLSLVFQFYICQMVNHMPLPRSFCISFPQFYLPAHRVPNQF